MPGEKLTSTTEQRLRNLLTILKQCPFKRDQEIPASVTSILYELNENLTQISYYAEDWRKSGYLAKKNKGSNMRHKLQQVTLSIVNLTKLLETVVQMPDRQYNQPNEEGEEEYMQQNSLVSNEFRRSFKGSRETQAIMDTLTAFEKKINDFKAE